VQGEPAKAPVAALLVNVTVPEGVMAVPVEVSVTVAVHEVATFVLTDAGLQTTLVVVVRTVTVTVVLPVLVA
jgi:hypothetical protein